MYRWKKDDSDDDDDDDDDDADDDCIPFDHWVKMKLSIKIILRCFSVKNLG